MHVQSAAMTSLKMMPITQARCLEDGADVPQDQSSSIRHWYTQWYTQWYMIVLIVIVMGIIQKHKL